MRAQTAVAPSRLRPSWGAQLNLPMRHWQGQRVWLVGASSGIGLACAQALHKAGAQVLLSARDLGHLTAWAKASALPGAGAGVELFPMDVTDAQQVQTAALKVLAGGPIDLIVYCAGHYSPQCATSFDLAQMLRHQDVNYCGLLRVLAAVLPNMLAQGHGHISLVSSVAGWRGLPKSLAYGPTKAAVTNLADTLYLDLKDHGIGVSVVHPGFVDTGLTAQNTFQMPALISKEQAAKEMLQGWAQGLFEIHFPKRFTLWLMLMRMLPHRIYFALVRRVTQL